jgi:hypothetical protein
MTEKGWPAKIVSLPHRLSQCVIGHDVDGAADASNNDVQSELLATIQSETQRCARYSRVARFWNDDGPIFWKISKIFRLVAFTRPD